MQHLRSSSPLIHNDYNFSSILLAFLPFVVLCGFSYFLSSSSLPYPLNSSALVCQPCLLFFPILWYLLTFSPMMSSHQTVVLIVHNVLIVFPALPLTFLLLFRSPVCCFRLLSSLLLFCCNAKMPLGPWAWCVRASVLASVNDLACSCVRACVHAC